MSTLFPSDSLGNHRTAKAPWRLSDGRYHPVTVRKIERPTQPTVVRLPDRSFDEPLPEGMGTWREYGFADCGYGCKVYTNDAGREVVGHNSAYGCRS